MVDVLTGQGVQRLCSILFDHTVLKFYLYYLVPIDPRVYVEHLYDTATHPARQPLSTIPTSPELTLFQHSHSQTSTTLTIPIPNPTTQTPIHLV
jgi:hypothetical protein